MHVSAISMYTYKNYFDSFFSWPSFACHKWFSNASIFYTIVARHTSGPLGAILKIQTASQELHERISLPKFRNCDVEFIDSNFLNKCYICCFLVAGHCIISRYLVPGSSQRAIIVRGSLSMPCRSNIEQNVEAGAFNHISRLQNHLSDIIQALYRACQALCHLTISKSHRPFNWIKLLLA